MMIEIRTIEALVEAFQLEGISDGALIEQTFAPLASTLMNHFAIHKGEAYYRFVEIEFYHNLTDEGSGVTYKRVTNTCDYFFHNSGVDLTFASSEEHYGGVLIRALACGDTFINGPLKVIDRLFDQFTALMPPEDFPVLVAHEFADRIEPMAIPRWNIPGDKKYRFVWPADSWPKPRGGYRAYPWDAEGKLK